MRFLHHARVVGAWRRREITPTLFRKYYVRGDLPISVHHRAKGNAIRWKIPPRNLDYHVYLPIFFDGLREVLHRCSTPVVVHLAIFPAVILGPTSGMVPLFQYF